MNGETQYRAPRRFAKRRGGPEATEHEHPAHLRLISASWNTQSRKLTIFMLA